MVAIRRLPSVDDDDGIVVEALSTSTGVADPSQNTSVAMPSGRNTSSTSRGLCPSQHGAQPVV